MNTHGLWWRAQREPGQQITGDKSKNKMGATESSARHSTPETVSVTRYEENHTKDSDDDELNTTPKAKAARTNDQITQVPSFTLQSGHDSGDEDEDRLPPPSFPAVNSAQRASGPASSLAQREPPKLKPLSSGSSGDSSLMPPPRLPQARQASSSAAGGLRVPSTGPLPNRGPTARSSNSLAPPPYKVTNMRQKVTLTPGHSPLDWAALQRSGKNLSGVKSMIRVTPSQLKSMNGRKGKPAWSSYQGKVYNMTPYIPFHPGGEGEIRRAAGKDGEKLFLEVHPWVNWDNMLGECLVGIMVSENEGADAPQSSLDNID